MGEAKRKLVKRKESQVSCSSVQTVAAAQPSRRRGHRRPARSATARHGKDDRHREQEELGRIHFSA